MRRSRKVCPVTEAGIRFIDYKDERFLARFGHCFAKVQVYDTVAR